MTNTTRSLTAVAVLLTLTATTALVPQPALAEPEVAKRYITTLRAEFGIDVRTYAARESEAYDWLKGIGPKGSEFRPATEEEEDAAEKSNAVGGKIEAERAETQQKGTGKDDGSDPTVIERGKGMLKDIFSGPEIDNNRIAPVQGTTQ